jgi:hypothetical protein
MYVPVKNILRALHIYNVVMQLVRTVVFVIESILRPLFHCRYYLCSFIYVDGIL